MGTFAWAYAFTRIYTRPFTRAEASRWIYQNVPGAINLRINNGDGEVNQPLAFRYGYTLPKDAPTYIQFTPSVSGQLTSLLIQHVLDRSPNPQLGSITVVLADHYPLEAPLNYSTLNETFTVDSDPRGKAYTIVFNQSVALEAGKTYYIGFQDTSQNAQLEIADAPILSIQVGEEVVKQALPEAVNALHKGMNFSTGFTPVQGGKLSRVFLDHIVDWEALSDQKILRLQIIDPVNLGQPLGTALVQNAFLPGKDPRGDGYWFEFGQPINLDPNKNYILQLDFIDGPGTLAVYGSKQAVESTWDDSLPLGLDGYSPYDFYSGVYRSDLNFEMYWDDNAEKLDRFETTLDQADYIFISSNRQWGTTVRVPERYPLTTLYYRSLMGCPADKQIIWCYSVAEPGMFSGQLGFDLVKTVESEPSIGGLTINSQFAEEAFTVYDHPKVMIFKKNASYDPQKVRDLLSSVDLSMVVHLTPGQASKYPGNLMLPEESLAVQQAGGTWSDLFHRNAIFNQYPGLAVVLWYLTISLMGWMLYPFTRLALRGLPDMGYPLTRLVGMLLLAYLVWLASSSGVAFSKTTISAVAVGLLGLGVILGWIQRKELAEELRTRKKYFLAVEVIALAFFTLFLLVRLGNSDLWHPWKGGEKPMDFSYFNAVLKSTTFPPYDPWFEGGYINYYYWGFVLVGVPTKWLGIIPSIAYNIFLPQLYSLLALGAFSAVWNIVKAVQQELKPEEEKSPYLAGVAGAVMLGFLGNLGSLRMIWYGLMKLSAPGGVFDNGNIFSKIVWTVEGLGKFFNGAHFPYSAGDWYWIPSRAIPGEPITEFPAFTFLYADPHAHLIALPITLLCLGWALSIAFGKWQWGDANGRLRWLHVGASLLLGGLAIGCLRPTNTWDYPLYLALGVVAIIYAAIRHGSFNWLNIDVPALGKKLGAAAVSTGLLVGLSLLLFQPFTRWYGQGYNAVDLWSGDHTPFWSYLTHWGLFLFLIISWLVWETREWMASTPVSALKKLRPYRFVIQGGFAVLGLAAIALVVPMKVSIGWLVLPVAAWAGILIFRPGMPAGRRVILFMTGAGLVLTLMVELIVLRGDIGRMNTVFKFYLQAWTLLSLSAAASLAWILPAVDRAWLPGWRNTWSVAAAFLIASAALFPLLGGTDKIEDRMSVYTPHTLDGMTYMAYSTYSESNVDLDLSQDYRAIRWMQDNIQGSPVIVEGNVTEYRWGNRYTIYTGLPGVIGWNWHQRQQRSTITPENWVTDRVKAVNEFYSTGDRQITVDFLKRYNVSYIIVGGMEHAIYPADGLAKFTEWNGDLWTAIYIDKDTVIYKVKR
jgi:YYY domain-containing protein